jgi:GTP cyclohydrolase I
MSEEIPEEHNCIFHRRIRALKTWHVKDTKTGQFFRYGLCPICANRLAKQESFKQDISDKIEEMLNDFNKKQEGKRANKI